MSGPGPAGARRPISATRSTGLVLVVRMLPLAGDERGNEAGEGQKGEEDAAGLGDALEEEDHAQRDEDRAQAAEDLVEVAPLGLPAPLDGAGQAQQAEDQEPDPDPDPDPASWQVEKHPAQEHVPPTA